MEITYLILCHKDPASVERLIDRLDSPGVSFMVHPDAKAGEFPLKERPNLTVLEKSRRVSVGWGDFGMIRAELELIDSYLASGAEGYAVLLSGQDYPIRPNAEIRSFFAGQDRDYISILPHELQRYRRCSKRNDINYRPWMFRQTFAVRLLRNLYIALTGGYYRTFGCFRRENTTGLTFEFGSQWWALRTETLRWIKGFIEERPQVTEFFSKAMVPDECFFQTVFAASPFAGTAANTVTYTNWDGGGHHPKTLTEEDLAVLINSRSCLFARKFDPGVSDGLKDRLDKMIQGEES